jgi:hypothetical protein
MRPIGRSALTFTHAGAVMVALGGPPEFAIELLLLLGREQRAHAGAGLMHLFAALMLEFLAQVHHLGARLVYDLKDLIVLRGRQMQLVLHSLDERSARNAQPSVAVG